MSLVVIPYALEVYLGIIAGRADESEFFEVRRRTAGGMACEFHPLEDRESVSESIRRHARQTDVYVGCAPRTRRAGTKDAVGRIWTLWAECDGGGAVDTLQRFDPPPALIIGSGSGVNCHAYWPLVEPLTPRAAEAANLRLAHAIGADRACFDAARILRPPGTWNHKHEPPVHVTTLRLDIDRTFSADHVLRNAPALRDEEQLVRRWRVHGERSAHGDPLLQIEPAVYVADLIGRAPGRNHKVACPFHDDERPSLHVFRTPERGWSCFSCGRGGSIYDLAAALWDMTPRGREFIQLRERLQERFAGELRQGRAFSGLERL